METLLIISGFILLGGLILFSGGIFVNNGGILLVGAFIMALSITGVFVSAVLLKQGDNKDSDKVELNIKDISETKKSLNNVLKDSEISESEIKDLLRLSKDLDIPVEEEIVSFQEDASDVNKAKLELVIEDMVLKLDDSSTD